MPRKPDAPRPSVKASPLGPATAAKTEVQAVGRGGFQEPVWLVRMVLVLFLVGFAAFLAREVRNFLSALP